MSHRAAPRDDRNGGADGSDRRRRRVAAPLDYRSLVRRITNDADVPLIELLRLLPEARSWPDVPRFSLGWDGHLNARAHARFGRALAHAIAPLVRVTHHLA